jgi:hypothetical protein
MNDEKSVGPLLVAGLLAILGTVAGGVITGYLQRSLAEKEFQTGLVMKALEAEEQEARINSLRFMIETNLIADRKIRDGLEAYLEREPETVPQFGPAVALAPGVVIPSTAQTRGFPDYDVFVCDAASGEAADSLANRVVSALGTTARVGEVRRRTWSDYEEVPLETLRNQLTIIVDADHPEASEVAHLRQQLREAVGNSPEIQELDNRGPATGWRISIVACP